MNPRPRSPASHLPTRRRFLQTATTAAATGPWLLSARGEDAEKIEVGFMGLNSRGSDLVKEFLASKQVTVTWLCDVDSRAIEKAGKIVAGQQVRAFKTTNDFRRALDDRRLQALVIAAPDHWHTPASILALKAGKAVYVEKPVSHNPREGELLVDTVRRTRGVLQVGLQRRTVPWVVDMVRRIHAGEFGAIHYARAWYAANRPSIGYGQLAQVPSWLDYELWQGPAPTRPFRDNVVHYHWHWFWHWGTGELGNNGVHYLDLARWAMKVDCPTRVSSNGGRYHYEDDQESPDTQIVSYDFGRRSISWEHRSCHPLPSEGESSGITFYGEKASVVVGGSGFRILGPDGKELEKVNGGTPTAPHVAAFLANIRQRSLPPVASADDGHKSTLLCHLGNIAQRLGRSIQMNPETSQLRDDREAARLWSREYRDGWQPAA